MFLACRDSQNLVFLVDSTISSSYQGEVRSFIRGVVEEYEVERSATQVAVVMYGRSADAVFDYDKVSFISSENAIISAHVLFICDLFAAISRDKVF